MLSVAKAPFSTISFVEAIIGTFFLLAFCKTKLAEEYTKLSVGMNNTSIWFSRVSSAKFISFTELTPFSTTTRFFV